MSQAVLRSTVSFGSLLTAVMLAGCSAPVSLANLSNQFRDSLGQLGQKAEETQTALQQGEDARLEAAEIGYDYADPRTSRFLERWILFDNKVRELRFCFNNTLETADFLFALCEKDAETISEWRLKRRILSSVRTRRSRFSLTARRASQKIATLEKAATKGNDIAKSIEVVGALSEISVFEDELNHLGAEAATAIDDVDELVMEGLELLNVELESFGQSSE